MFRRRHRRNSPPSALPPKVLLISASMGAGHDGAARGLASEIVQAGYEAEVRDFLDSGPLRIGSALRSGYEFELRHLPGAYDATYRLWYRVPWLSPIVAWLVTVLTRRRILRWIRDTESTVVVSTYPLATLCLGRLRSTGALRIPAVNFITDFGVHPLWVHKGIDLNLAVHDGPAAMANRRTGRPTIACGPVVSPAFSRERLPDRTAKREALGLGPEDRAVLVVAGSWGVGDLRHTWEAISGGGRFTPVVVCGRDTRLQEQMAALASTSPGRSMILGWTDDMPALMSACDALVENAGGLTSLEAMRAGLPVVSFQPIAGHGKENTAAMSAAGVSRLAADSIDLASALEDLTSAGAARDAQVALGREMFRADAAPWVLSRSATPLAEPARRPVKVALRAVASAAATSAVVWLGLTSGVAVAAEAGAGVAHPAPHAGPVAYIGVRLDESQMANPTVAATIRRMDLTAVVDDQTAAADPAALRYLAAQGVNIENGGLGDFDGLAPWRRAEYDARASSRLGQMIGQSVKDTVPGRRLNAWDLVDCGDNHTLLVVPNHILDAAKAPLPGSIIHLSGHHIYLINGLAATPQELVSYLQQLGTSLQAAHLDAKPLASLA